MDTTLASVPKNVAPEAFPFLASWDHDAKPVAAALRQLYTEYVTTVSTSGQAASFRTGVLLYLVARGLGARRVLDLGSGWSSVAVRAWQRDAGFPVTIDSVDTDPAWLAKTEGFLRAHGLDTSGLQLWRGLVPQEEYDFVFHDLGTMTTRIATLEKVGALAHGGVLVLDDMHKPGYMAAVARWRESLPPHAWYELAAYTRDELGRYVGAADLRAGASRHARFYERPYIIVPVHVPNDIVFYQLRLLLESVVREVPAADRAGIVVVDDHSPYRGPYFEYLAWLLEGHGVEHFVAGEARASFYGPTGRGHEGRDPNLPLSIGHGGALNAGVQFVRDRGRRWVWTLDSDSLVLDGTCLREAMDLTRLEGVASVGDYERGRPAPLAQSFDEDAYSLFEDGGWIRKRQRRNVREGRTNACCALFDASLFGRRIASYGGVLQFHNGGHAHGPVVSGLFEHGYRTAYYPFYQREKVVHFGYGTLGFVREHFGDADVGYGNAAARGQYGRKQEADYYAGYLQVQLSTRQLHDYLRELYQRRPFDDASARFDRKLLRPPRVNQP